MRNPRRTNFDMALFKRFVVKESIAFEFRAEAFNVFNHTQWAALAGAIRRSGAQHHFVAGTNRTGRRSNCLQVGAAHNPRILQLSAKFIF